METTWRAQAVQNGFRGNPIKASVVKVPFREEEDAKLLELVKRMGAGNWHDIVLT